MEKQQYRKFYVDWWRIRRNTVYGIGAFCLIAVVGAFAAWYAIRYDWFAESEAAATPTNAARIISFEGDVRITRAATRETIVVTKEMQIDAGDTIQTQDDGRATVQMVDGSVYSVKPNSTVVIRDNSSLFGGTNVRVSLDDGQIKVRTDEQGENTQNVVEMLDSETRLKSQTDASFDADAARNGGEIRISRGSVETTVGGQQSTINANEFASVNRGSITSRETLLGPPALLSPGNMSQIADNSGGGGVTVSFTWQNSSDIPVSGYYLQVGRSPFFASDSILVDRGSITARDFRLAGLSPGTYYWRLKTTARSGQTSEWSEPWRFNVVRPGSSGAIDVAGWKVERVGGNVYFIGGQTRPGLTVRSQNREVFAGPDGAFRMQISTPLSEVAVEFADERGNRAGFVLSLRNAKVLRRF